MEILLKGIGWVVQTFSDGSKRVVRTTLNQNILRTYGVTAKNGYLFNLDSGCYYPVEMMLVILRYLSIDQYLMIRG